MRKTKKLCILILSLVLACSAAIGVMAFAADRTDPWTLCPEIDARADQNGWITNYVGQHTIAHSVADGMSTMTNVSGGPAYNANNVYELIAAGKEITFRFDNSESGSGATYMGLVLTNKKPDPWDTGGFGFNSGSAVIGLITNTVSWQVHLGASRVMAIQNPLAKGEHKITFYIGENKGDSYFKMDDTVMQGENGTPEAGKSVLSQVSKADFTNGEAYIGIIGVNTDATCSISAIAAPGITEVTGNETAISVDNPRDVTAKVAATGTPKLALRNAAGEIVNVPAEYYTYDAASKLLTIRKEIFTARSDEMYLPLETVFYVIDDTGYGAINVDVKYLFDDNGWNTTLMNGSTHGTAGGGGVLASPKTVDGYTSYGHNVARIYNYNKLDVTQPISFEFAIAADDASWWYRLMLVDSATAVQDIVASDPIGTPKPLVGMIFKADYSAAQIVSGAAAAKEVKLSDYGCKTGLIGSATQADKKIAVKIVIGADAADSKVYLNGKAAFDLNVNRASFPSGMAQVAFFPQGGTDLLVSGFGRPVIESVENGDWTYEAPKDVKLTITDAFALDPADVRVGFTERLTSVSALQKAKYIYLEEGDFTVEGNVVTVKSAAFGKFLMPQESYLKVETSKGCSTTVITVKNGEIDYIGSAELRAKLDLTEDYAIDFTYQGSETFTLSQTIADTADTAKAVKAEDFVVAAKAGAEGTYTLSLKKDYLNSLEAGVYHFFLKTGAGNLDWYLYLEPAEPGWVVRSTKGSVSDNTEDVYQTLSLNPNSSDYYLSGRAFYSEGLDVTKPIYLELEFPTDSAGWVVLGMSDSPYDYEYFTESTRSVLMRSIFQPKANANGIRWEPFGGFTSTPSIAIDTYFNADNLNLFEFYIGTTDESGSDPGYVKFNGQTLATTPKVLQSDFAGGKVYLGWFKGAGEVSFKVNRPNAVGVKDLSDEILRYTLGSTSALDLELVNNSENLTVTGASGEALDESLYTVSGNVLSILPDYFGTYRQKETFRVTDNDRHTATQFTVTYDVTITGSGKMAFIDTAEDVEVAVDALASEITAVILDGSELSADLFAAADNKITLKAANFTEEGEYIFVVAAKGGYIPLYVSFRPYENGGVQTNAEDENAGSVTVSGDVWTFGKGAVEYLFERSVDFSEGLTFVLNVAEVHSALNDGNELDTAGYFGFKFTDIYSGYVIEYRVYANWLPSAGEERNVAVYAFIYNNAGLQVNKQSYTYKSALLGQHVITLSLGDAGFEIGFDDQPNTILFDLDSYPMFTDNMMFAFQSLAASGDKDLTVAGSVSFTLPSYKIAANEGITAPASAKEGETVTFTVAEREGYTYEVTVKQGDTVIAVSDNSFTMPKGDVTITVTYTEKPPEDQPKKGCRGAGLLGGGFGGVLLMGLVVLPFLVKRRRDI